MLLKRLVIVLCALASACTPGGKTEAVSGPAALALQDAAATACPWPADVARYEQTTLTQRQVGSSAPDLALLRDVPSGCSVLTFAVNEQGVVANADVVSASPAGFARIAPEILRWNDYATGDSPMAVFMVRLGALRLADGGVLVSLAFKDSAIAIVVPVSAGR